MKYITIGELPGLSPAIPLILGGGSVAFAAIAVYLLVNHRKYTLSEWFPLSTWTVGILSVLLAAGTLLSLTGVEGETFTPNLSDVESQGYEIRGDATDPEGNPLPDQDQWPTAGGVTLPLRHADTGSTCLGVTTSTGNDVQLAVACYGQ